MLKPFSLVLSVLLLCAASTAAGPLPPRVTAKSASGVSVTKELDRAKKSGSLAMPKVKRPGIVRAARAGVVHNLRAAWCVRAGARQNASRRPRRFQVW